MRIEGGQHIGAGRAAVWAALNDPEVLRAALPGCESLSHAGEDAFSAVVAVKIGPIGARFSGEVLLSEKIAGESYTITGTGKGGMAGHARGIARVQLADAAGGTLLNYVVEAEVGGRLAQLGGPVVEATAQNLAARFFANLERELNGGAPQSATATATALPTRTSTGLPWHWLAVIALAVLAGFMLGRNAAQDWWAGAVIMLAVVAAAAGYSAGRKAER